MFIKGSNSSYTVFFNHKCLCVKSLMTSLQYKLMTFRDTGCLHSCWRIHAFICSSRSVSEVMRFSLCISVHVLILRLCNPVEVELMMITEI